ncbi:hypothetical protein [Gordonia hydrophobica]|uniref:Uncharacterized protein n=1 Tax=Gordonia hydrophobica TaxID=40516 RepID=A0ABZ2U3X1_9ACTN|nr:hypothetical protein [Gordonia hydrophobica]MBM7367912.1 4-hydroxybenzoate polyprenyltransferase [Gordonia hydrophobica]
MASNHVTSSRVTPLPQGRIHVWRMLVMLAILVGVFAALLLIVASAV